MAKTIKKLPTMRETWVQSLGWEDPLEEGMATHSSTLAWRIPMDRVAWGLQSRGHKELDTTERLSTVRKNMRLKCDLSFAINDLSWHNG